MKPDLEKVIRGLECCIKQAENDVYCEQLDCPYKSKADSCRLTCWTKLNRDALALLKAQPYITATGNGIAVGQVTGGMTINRTYNQTANSVTNIKNVGELHV